MMLVIRDVANCDRACRGVALDLICRVSGTPRDALHRITEANRLTMGNTDDGVLWINGFDSELCCTTRDSTRCVRCVYKASDVEWRDLCYYIRTGQHEVAIDTILEWLTLRRTIANKHLANDFVRNLAVLLGGKIA